VLRASSIIKQICVVVLIKDASETIPASIDSTLRWGRVCKG
jgi:hypothetical protein